MIATSFDSALHAFTRTTCTSFYRTASNEAALASLQTCARAHAGVALLIGPPLCGKSTLLEELILTTEHTREILHGACRPDGAVEFEHLSADSGGPSCRIPQLERTLRSLKPSHVQPLVCVDGADRLPDSDLATLARIFQPAAIRPGALLLVATENLLPRWNATIRGSRTASRTIKLSGFTLSESTGFLKSCLRASGVTDDPFADAQVYRGLYLHSAGLPGMLKRWAAESIRVAQARQAELVTTQHVQLAATVLAPPATNVDALRELEQRLLGALQQVRNARQQASARAYGKDACTGGA